MHTRLADVGFDIAECSDNRYNDWSGAQIRADLYGWVPPGDPTEVARLTGIDASLSHRASASAARSSSPRAPRRFRWPDSIDDAVERACRDLPDGAETATIDVGRRLVGRDGAIEELHAEYPELSPIQHAQQPRRRRVGAAVAPDDFGSAIGDAVEAGWDTD